MNGQSLAECTALTATRAGANGFYFYVDGSKAGRCCPKKAWNSCVGTSPDCGAPGWKNGKVAMYGMLTESLGSYAYNTFVKPMA